MSESMNQFQNAEEAIKAAEEAAKVFAKREKEAEEKISPEQIALSNYREKSYLLVKEMSEIRNNRDSNEAYEEYKSNKKFISEFEKKGFNPRDYYLSSLILKYDKSDLSTPNFKSYDTDNSDIENYIMSLIKQHEEYKNEEVLILPSEKDKKMAEFAEKEHKKLLSKKAA
jgi:hypothetical protein